jgi:membrane-bound inhibitor of C-type lysozyme
VKSVWSGKQASFGFVGVVGLLLTFAFGARVFAGAQAQGELPGPSVTSRGPFEWACTSASGGTETLKATFYNTQPGLVLMERGGKMRPAFQAVSGSGARYVWKDVSYWEHQGQATVRWSETELTCKRSGGPGSD